MSYSAAAVVGYGPGISTFGRYSCIDLRAAHGSAVWPTANLALYVPVRIPRTCIVLKLGLLNGSAVSGNFDVGIYTAAGTRVVSTTSTAQSGTMTEQIVDITDTTLAPGLYYFAAVLDNTTGTIRRIPINSAANGVFSEQLGSAALPATATFSLAQISYIPGVVAFVEGTAT